MHVYTPGGKGFLNQLFRRWLSRVSQLASRSPIRANTAEKIAVLAPKFQTKDSYSSGIQVVARTSVSKSEVQQRPSAASDGVVAAQRIGPCPAGCPGLSRLLLRKSRLAATRMKL